MAGNVSAGLLMYRIRDGSLQVLLAHPGGPFFQNKDEGVWSILKGEIEPDEDVLEAAKPESEEETGVAPTGPFVTLSPTKQKAAGSSTPGRRRVTAIPHSSTIVDNGEGQQNGRQLVAVLQDKLQPGKRQRQCHRQSGRGRDSGAPGSPRFISQQPLQGHFHVR